MSKGPDIKTSELFVNTRGWWECRQCGRSALLYGSISHHHRCAALIWPDFCEQHQWRHHQNPDTPDGPGEHFIYCNVCGAEKEDDL